MINTHFSSRLLAALALGAALVTPSALAVSVVAPMPAKAQPAKAQPAKAQPAHAQPAHAQPQSTPSADPFTQAKESMVILYPSGLDPCNKPADTLKFLGSGFLLNVSGKHNATYLITNKHVIEKHNSIIVRANAGKGCVCKEVSLTTEGAQATVIMPKEATVNLVAISLPAMGDVHPLVIDPKMLVDFESLKTTPITEGHDIYAADIFIPGEGATTENYGFIRNGKIALVRTDNWMQSVYGNAQAYLGQLATTFGATGVPVFLADSRRILGVTKAVAFSPAPVAVDVPETKVEDGIPVPQTVAAKGAAIIPNGVIFIEPAHNLKALMQQLTER